MVGRGWSGIKNGDLLDRVSGHYDALITMDRSMEFQQPISTFPFGIVIVGAVSNRMQHLRPLVPAMLTAIAATRPGRFSVSVSDAPIQRRSDFITPGKPVQNAHIESFHGRFRDECLNESWFLTLADAQRIIEAWRQDYNAVRPHSALGYLTPEEFEQMSLNGAEPARDQEPAPRMARRR